MKLTRAMAYALIEGRKTVERRPYKRGKSPAIAIGKTYPVVIAGGSEPTDFRPVATVRVTWFERERLGKSETVEDCRAEGFGGLDPIALRRDYWERHLGGYSPDREVWRVDLELVSVEKAAA